MKRSTRIKSTAGAIIATAAIAAAVTISSQEQQLAMWYLDMEGGGGTLVVAPSGQSLLIDVGNPGLRDSGRAVAVAKQAGVKQIDYFLATHYHGDHYGGIVDLVRQIPVRTFVDIGPFPVEEMTQQDREGFSAYSELREKARHFVVSPGDKIPIDGLDITVVTAKGRTLKTPLAAAGAPNSLCGDLTPRYGNIIDSNSVGVHIQYGLFRAMLLGDLTWNKEHELACPNNVIGTVDVFQTSAHGLNLSSPPELLHAIRPRVVIINNAAKKGATRETFATVKQSPGLEDLWSLHFAMDRPPTTAFETLERTDQGGKAFNPPDAFIANIEEHAGDSKVFAPAHSIKLIAGQDGAFTVQNSRTGFEKTYRARR
jgi:competence protein ComEC